MVVIRPTIIATTITTVTRPRPPSASISMATRRLRQKRFGDVAHPDRVDGEIVPGHRADAPDRAPRRARARGGSREATGRRRTPRPRESGALRGVSHQLVDGIRAALHHEGAALVDSRHRLDASIGRAEHGARIAVDCPGAVPEPAGEKRVEARTIHPSCPRRARTRRARRRRRGNTGLQRRGPPAPANGESASLPIAWPMR